MCKAYNAFMHARAALLDVLPQSLHGAFDKNTRRFCEITGTVGSEGDEETDEKEY